MAEVEEAEDTSMRQRKAPTTAGSKLTILTYNAGLLRFQLLGPCGLGGTVFSNPPCVPERFPHLAAALLDSGADIIALQEVYEKTHVAALATAVAGTYPHSASRYTGGGLNFTNGLMYVSKFPLTDVAVLRHKQSAGVEKCLGSKCLLAATVSTPVGELRLIGCHLTAGGGLSPEAVDACRESELEEVCVGEGCVRLIV